MLTFRKGSNKDSIGWEAIEEAWDLLAQPLPPSLLQIPLETDI
jgi:hypothetical protein